MQNDSKIPGVVIIAEVKPWSPFGKKLTQNSWERQLELADKVGDMISVHTNPLWKGSFDLIGKARSKTQKPILAKGFHATDDEVSRAIDMGADYVLVVGRMPSVHIEKCFIEPLTLDELAGIPDKYWAVWNSRDLATLRELPEAPRFILDRWEKGNGHSERVKESFIEARKVFSGRLCQASNLHTKDDVEPGADAVLVGTYLESFAESLGVSL